MSVDLFTGVLCIWVESTHILSGICTHYSVAVHVMYCSELVYNDILFPSLHSCPPLPPDMCWWEVRQCVQRCAMGWMLPDL